MLEVMCFIVDAIPDKPDTQGLPCDQVNASAGRRLQLIYKNPWPRFATKHPIQCCFQKQKWVILDWPLTIFKTKQMSALIR